MNIYAWMPSIRGAAMLGVVVIGLWFLNWAAPQFFDWRFFVLLFGTGSVSVCAKLFHDASFLDRPIWAAKPAAQITLTLINLPLYWSNTIVSIYGFFILPWYTVVICIVADLIAGGVFGGCFLMPAMRRFGVFVALLISYVIATLTALWYFGSAREMHAHTLDLGSYLGIGVCVCFVAKGLFLACHAGWKNIGTKLILWLGAGFFIALWYLPSLVNLYHNFARPRLLAPGDRIWHAYCLWINTYDEDTGRRWVKPFPDDEMPNYSCQVIGDEDVVYYDPVSYRKALQTGVDQDPPIKHLFLKDPERWILQEQPPDRGRELKH